tara:strand:- start:126 stop:770 length:645 start_codon:yes stop_codon:yes gene_type:complete
MKILIPARKGSKRIPNKNIVEVNGRPLISYTIKTCLELTDEVYVSTDCEQIEELARKYGAKTIKRPSELSTDQCPAGPVVEHFLETVEGVDSFVFVQPTSPLITSDQIKKGLRRHQSWNYDTVLAVYEESQFRWNKDGSPDNFKVTKKPLSQDLFSWYVECGAFYITTKEKFMETKSLIGGRIGFIVLPKLNTVDIDTYDDLKLVESIMKMNDA